MVRVLLFSDDSADRDELAVILAENYRVEWCKNYSALLANCSSFMPEFILLKSAMFNGNLTVFLPSMKDLSSCPLVFLYSDTVDVPEIVTSIKLGIDDYIIRPFSIENLSSAFLNERYKTRNQYDDYLKGSGELDLHIIGTSQPMVRCKSQIEMYSNTGASVLINGQSGTGKELAAKMIHSLSSRKTGPFVAKNCAAIPETLFESEIFGCVKGAFTEAVARPGWFEAASGGTLFLDEIGDLTLQAQAKILRVLEEKQVQRLGALQPTTFDTRFVFATNKDLEKEVQKGNFRSDLFYRIDMLRLLMPPLSGRREDIPLLVRKFVQDSEHSSMEFSVECLEELMNQNWPGNIRELKNVVRRALFAAYFAKEEIVQPHHLRGW